MFIITVLAALFIFLWLPFWLIGMALKAQDNDGFNLPSRDPDRENYP